MVIWVYLLDGFLMIVNISEAKAQLSRLIDRVYHGEKVVIAKNNLPIADLVIHKPEGKRKLGLLEGKLHLPDDLLEEDEEINAMFYGEAD
jgi:antitoxin (DNA-binding transcriptional repressor) of toxin-antitoxin stability system